MKTPRKTERSTRLEALEAREMLAADVFLQDGILKVNGSQLDDRIEVAEVANEKIRVTIKSAGSDLNKTFQASNVSLIEVYGKGGNDQIRNDTSIRSKLIGGNGQDVIHGGSANDMIRGGNGNDRLFGKQGNDRLFGNGGADRLMGNAGNDILIGHGGHDKLFGHGGNDLLRGGNGNDRLMGGGGNDKLQGEVGNDQIFGQGGDDELDGASGADSINGGSGTNQILGGAGDTFTLVGNDAVKNSDVTKLQYSVVNRILEVIGSDQDDNIRVEGDGNSISIFDRDNLVGNFKGIQSVEVVAKAGQDTVDLSDLAINARVFGGDDNDTIKGGSAVDIIFGGMGDDTITGGGGNDVLYGDDGKDTILGDAGKDWISFGTTPDGRSNDVRTFLANDINIEKMDYDSKVLFDLQHRFRDKFGYVMLQSHGKPHPDGEGTYVTAATAAGLAAQTYGMSKGNQLDDTNQLIEELLFTLLHHSWDSHGNPVRHPEILDFDKDGNVIRVNPMTKDSFGQIITAALYSYQSPNTTSIAKELAVDLVQKWNEYLIINQFRTLPEHVWQEMKTANGGLEYEIYSKGEDGTLNKSMPKGPEAYLLLPHERYALKNVGARIGLQTSNWDVWKGFGDSIDQVVADYVANLAEQGVKTLLKQIKFSKSIDVELSYKGKVYFEIDQSISFDISSSSEDRISAAVGNLIKGAMKMKNLANSGDQLKGLVVDRLLDSVPKQLGVDVWRPIMTTAVNQILPWLNGEVLVETASFMSTLQLMKNDSKPANFGYSVWPFLAEMETRPEVNDLLRPFVRDMVGYLRGKDVDNGMWAHIGRDPGAVANQLDRFRNEPIGRDRWSDFSLHRGKEFWDREFNADKASARIDYVVLNGLHTKGAPDGLGDVVSDWAERMADAAEDALMGLVEQAKREFANAGKYLQEKWDAAGDYIKERWDAAGNYAKEKWDAAGNYAKEKWDSTKNYIFEKGNSVGKTYVEARDSSGKLISKAWNNGTKWIEQKFDSAGKLLKEWVYYDEAGKKLHEFRKWASGKLTDFEQYTKAGWKSVDKWVSDKGQWISQRLDSAGKLLKEWVYYDEAGKKLHEYRKWASGKLTDFEQYTKAGWKSVDKWVSDKGQWISQRLDSAGKLLKEWVYYDEAGKKLHEYRKWASGKLTDFEQYTKAGWKSVDKWVSDKGQWISQRLDSAGKLLKEWVYYDEAGKKLHEFRKWASGKLTDFEQYTKAGWKSVDKWVSDKGQWISQRLDSAGKVFKEWVYYDAGGQKLKQWATWSGKKLSNLERYAISGGKTLDAYFSTSGHWVEKTFHNGKETAVRFWTESGKYVGDKLKNFKDSTSKLDPTTRDWWPL